MKRENTKEQVEHLKNLGIDTANCFECGSSEDLQYHHIIPYAQGGKRVIPLCGSCHNTVHLGEKRSDNLGELIKQGIKRKKDAALAKGERFIWGNTHNMPNVYRKAGQDAAVAKADEFQNLVVEALRPVMELTLAKKVEYLNTQTDVRTRRGKKWSVANLHRCLKRTS